jgi:membrane protein implicated in regulation of membrane protease activity
MNTARAKPFRKQRTGAIFFAPLLIAVITAGGLLSALLGDGVWDAVSWLTLSIPLMLIAWYAPRRQPRAPAETPTSPVR